MDLPAYRISRVDLWGEEKPEHGRIEQLHALLEGGFNTLSGIAHFTSELETESVRLFEFRGEPKTNPDSPPVYSESRLLNLLWYASNVAVNELYHRRIDVAETRSLAAILQNSMYHVARTRQDTEHAEYIKEFLSDFSALHDGRLQLNVKSDEQYRSIFSAITIVGLLQHYDMLEKIIEPLREHMKQSKKHPREALQYAYFHISAAFFRACHEVQDAQGESVPFAWYFPMVMQLTQEYIMSPSEFEEAQENVLMLQSVGNLSDYLIGKGGEHKSIRNLDSVAPF